ncbi:hypothetical protein O3P69_004534 [Scylla paramamosain]|uniref:Uncharacterized protein n=1 Tax=Scylla paramamosain TaxID=85552 RepID=A0AAW0UFT7_SCYPA
MLAILNHILRKTPENQTVVGKILGTDTTVLLLLGTLITHRVPVVRARLCTLIGYLAKCCPQVAKLFEGGPPHPPIGSLTAGLHAGPRRAPSCHPSPLPGCYVAGPSSLTQEEGVTSASHVQTLRCLHTLCRDGNPSPDEQGSTGRENTKRT